MEKFTSKIDFLKKLNFDFVPLFSGDLRKYQQIMKKIIAILLFIVSTSIAGNIPSGVVLTDNNGVTYDFDALLSLGKSIIIHKNRVDICD